MSWPWGVSPRCRAFGRWVNDGPEQEGGAPNMCASSARTGRSPGGRCPTVADTIRTHPDIDNYDELFRSDRRTIARYETSEAGLYDYLRSSSLPPEFPIIAENGDMEFDITATQEQFDAFGTVLDESERTYDLVTLVHTDEEEPLLTDRQREYLTLAHRRGYFEVPRSCTLAEVAEALEVDKSTASATIRRGTARIVDQFLLDRW